MTGEWYPGFHAARGLARPALVDARSGAQRSYAEVDELANRTSHLLRRLGLETGDHVALWFDNDVDYPALWTGARYAGLHFTLVSTRLTVEETAYIVSDSGSRVVLLGRRLADEHGAALAAAVGAGVTLVADDDGANSLRARLATESPEPLADRVEGLPMLYSSGTTGRPKAVTRELGRRELGADPSAVMVAQLFGIDEQGVYLSPAPLYHAAPYGWVNAMLGVGATAVVMDHFDAEAFLAAIERYRITHVQLVPTMFVRLLALPEDTRGRYDLRSLQKVIHAAAPCPVPVKQQMLDWWGPIIWEYYSGTEGVGFTMCAPEEWLAHPGTVGRPVGGEVHIVGDDGAEVPAGVDGDVYFSGRGGFTYHNDPEKTKGSYLDNGWATFGDIGHVDEDGYLFLTDRRANMIIVGGVNVYPQEAENLLVTHPSVVDAAVFGIAHPEMGEEVKAVVQPAPGVTGGPELESALMAFCREHLASVKCPRSIDFRDDLPREPNGKLLKRKLVDEYRSRRGRSGVNDAAKPGAIFSDPVAYADPVTWHAAAAEIRRDTPILRVETTGFPPFWAITTHADVLEIERHPDVFTNSPVPTLVPASRVASMADTPVKTLVQLDGEQHRLHRHVVNDWFLPGSVKRLQERVDVLATQAVDRMAVRGDRCDFANDVALRFPLQVILSILGLPEDDYDRMLQLTQELFGAEDPDIGRMGEDQAAVILDFVAYFGELAADRRRHPTSDLASVIANATIDGQPLADLEMLGHYLIIATAGHDTTSSAIAGGLVALLEQPDQLELLRAEPDLIDGAFADEVVRHVSPVKHFMRNCQEPFTLRDTTFEPGDLLYLSFASANRDDAVFVDPDRFDVRRENAASHLGFGFGRHFCLGVHLARMEIRAIFKELVRRVEHIELDGEPTWTQASFVEGPKRVPITYRLR